MRLGLGFGLDNHRRLLSGFVGLLDTYSGAAAAYSIRLLSSTYTGALVEIRRSSDNALKSFYPDSNNELSLNSEDGAGTSLSSWIGSDNGFIRTWFDQSGNSLNYTQTTAANQSQIINAGALRTENGKPIIRRTATDSTMLANVLVNNFTNSTFFYVGKQYTDQTRLCLFGCASGGSTGIYLGESGSTNTTITLNTSLSNVELNDATFSPSNRGDIYTAFSNQFLLGFNASSFTFQNNNLSLGYNHSNPIGFSMLSSQEIVIYDSDQSSNRTGIESNINGFYSIY